MPRGLGEEYGRGAARISQNLTADVSRRQNSVGDRRVARHRSSDRPWISQRGRRRGGFLTPPIPRSPGKKNRPPPIRAPEPPLSHPTFPPRKKCKNGWRKIGGL